MLSSLKFNQQPWRAAFGVTDFRRETESVKLGSNGDIINCTLDRDLYRKCCKIDPGDTSEHDGLPR